MYAVIKTGGKQYKVSAGEKLKVESIPADVGAQITLDQVLLVADGDSVTMGTPLVAGASVNGDRGRARAGREDQDLQAAPAQALSQDPRAPAELHRDSDQRHQRPEATAGRSSYGT